MAAQIWRNVLALVRLPSFHVGAAQGVRANNFEIGTQWQAGGVRIVGFGGKVVRHGLVQKIGVDGWIVSREAYYGRYWPGSQRQRSREPTKNVFFIASKHAYSQLIS